MSFYPELFSLALHLSRHRKWRKKQNIPVCFLNHVLCVCKLNNAFPKSAVSSYKRTSLFNGPLYKRLLKRERHLRNKQRIKSVHPPYLCLPF